MKTSNLKTTTITIYCVGYTSYYDGEESSDKTFKFATKELQEAYYEKLKEGLSSKDNFEIEDDSHFVYSTNNEKLWENYAKWEEKIEVLIEVPNFLI